MGSMQPSDGPTLSPVTGAPTKKPTSDTTTEETTPDGTGWVVYLFLILLVVGGCGMIVLCCVWYERQEPENYGGVAAMSPNARTPNAVTAAPVQAVEITTYDEKE